MKLFSLFAVTLLASFALADEPVVGRATLTLLTDHGTLITEIYQKGDRILGHTDFGRIGMVNLKITEERPGTAKYEGVAGGNSLTNLRCKSYSCQGVIAGKSAAFRSTQTLDKKNELETHETGHLDHSSVKVLYMFDKIEVTTWEGSMSLKRTSEGGFEGRGSMGFRWSRHPMFTARLETSGTLLDLKNEALRMIFLAQPISRN
jgi:hypothetical protein